MNSRTEATARWIRLVCVLILFTMLIGGACKQSANTTVENRSTPANTAVASKPTESETKQAPAAPAGKEVKPGNGPALKSIEPPEGAVLGGVLNDLATSLPTPDPAAAKAANESGKVTVEVLVNEKGEVSTSSVVSGPQPLWRAAGEAARQARFAPPLKDGKPVKVAGVLIYEFTK
jgi:TonB family protein